MVESQKKLNQHGDIEGYNFLEQSNRLTGTDDGGTEITFSDSAIFAYDAVWSMALGLDAVSAELPQVCGNGTSLGDYDPLERGPGRDVGRCIAELLTSRIGELSFSGLAVSWTLSTKSSRPMLA